MFARLNEQDPSLRSRMIDAVQAMAMAGNATLAAAAVKAYASAKHEPAKLALMEVAASAGATCAVCVPFMAGLAKTAAGEIRERAVQHHTDFSNPPEQ